MRHDRYPGWCIKREANSDPKHANQNYARIKQVPRKIFAGKAASAMTATKPMQRFMARTAESCNMLFIRSLLVNGFSVVNPQVVALRYSSRQSFSSRLSILSAPPQCTRLNSGNTNNKLGGTMKLKKLCHFINNLLSYLFNIAQKIIIRNLRVGHDDSAGRDSEENEAFPPTDLVGQVGAGEVAEE